jgi:hypothetical protein
LIRQADFVVADYSWLFSRAAVGTASRREALYPRYAAHVEAIGRQTPGVTAVFFSSYEFLERVRPPPCGRTGGVRRSRRRGRSR